MTTAFERARAICDAVLYQGYLLYPYRASAAKNRMRWQFGVLMPPAYASPDRGEHSDAGTECLLEPRKGAVVHVRARFLQVQERAVYERGEDGAYRPVAELTAAGQTHTTWEEAVERETEIVLRVPDVVAAPVAVPFRFEGTEQAEDIPGGRLVRRTRPLNGVLRARAEQLDGPFGGVRLRVELINTGRWHSPEPSRQDALRQAFLAAHLVLGIDGGRFLSLLEPPEWAAPAAKVCRNDRLWPVLIGEPGRDDAMLASPIIFYDHPAVAPESQGELFDGTEIDEILTLRTMALTEDEKRQARATDERARALVDRIDNMPPELLERLHGTIRYLRSVTGEADAAPQPGVPWWDPGAEAAVSPETDVVAVAGVLVSAGSRVRLRPSSRRGDAQDMFLTGLTATVRAVLSDVDGGRHVAVTVDDDPAAELQHAHGRYRYFAPDELEPLPQQGGPT
jgi:hypothetical protein